MSGGGCRPRPSSNGTGGGGHPCGMHDEMAVAADRCEWKRVRRLPPSSADEPGRGCGGRLSCGERRGGHRPELFRGGEGAAAAALDACAAWGSCHPTVVRWQKEWRRPPPLMLVLRSSGWRRPRPMGGEAVAAAACGAGAEGLAAAATQAVIVGEWRPPPPSVDLLRGCAASRPWCGDSKSGGGRHP